MQRQIQTISTIDTALVDLKNGKPIVVVDDENRENEGDLIALAEKATPELVSFMARESRVFISVPLTKERAAQLQLQPTAQQGKTRFRCNFTTSVDASPRFGVKTGSSAKDRACTIQLLAKKTTKPNDFVCPGHVFPIIAKEGGVLVRAGHTEAAVDLARLAGAQPVGVISEIMKENGEMARLPDLIRFAQKYDLRLITIRDLIAYRRKREKLIIREGEARIPTPYGTFRAIGYRTKIDKREHIALVFGTVAGKKNVLTRVHSECLTGDVFSSLRCDCHAQIHAALQKIAQEKCGVLLYMRQEGRGIGLTNKLKAYKLQEKGYDTVQANRMIGFKDDLREYGIGVQILADLGLTDIRLMTNNPRKIIAIEGHDIRIKERVPLEISPRQENKKYLQTKKKKLGHFLNMV